MSADRTNTADALRKKAEALLAKLPEVLQPEDLTSVNKLAHELAVHQAELEMQNEELRDTQMALQGSRDRFAALFEYAPVGYVILDSSGIIRQTNATWRAMLGRPDDDLRGTPFANTLADEDAPIFLSRFRAFFRNPAEKRIIARMKRNGVPPFYAQIEAKAHGAASETASGASPSQLMVIVSDISDLQQARGEIEIRNEELGRANERFEHINRVLLGIRNVNQLIVTEDDPRRLIEQACMNLTETMGYLNAWIALVGGEAGQALGLPGQGAVAAAASAGFDGDFEVLRERLERGEFPGCMARALKAENTVVSGNPVSDCTDCPLSRDYSGRAALVRRLHFDGVTYGVFTASVPANYARETDEQELFDEVADDLAFALHKIATARRLNESRRRYREIFEHSRDGFVMVDAAGLILDANSALCEMLGYTLDELRSLPNFYAITPVRWHEWESKEIWEKRLLGRGYSGIYEKEYIRKDGTAFPVELNSYLVRSEYGGIDYLWGTARDITERKRAEEVLRRDTERLKAIIDILQYECVDIQEFLDYSLDRAIDITASKIGYIYFYDEDRRQFVLNSWSRDVMNECAVTNPQTCYELDKTGVWGEAVRQRKPILINDFQAHHTLKKGYPEGHVHLKRFLTVPVFYQGRIVAVAGVANKESEYDQTDILELTLLMDAVWKSTETIKSEKALREAEAYQRQILQTTADGFWVIDNREKIVDVNEAYCAMSGYSHDELLGMGIGDLDVVEQPEETAARIRRIIKNGHEIFETRHRRKDGSILPVEVSTTYLKERGGQFVCFCRDLTQRKQTEERLNLLGRMLDAAPACITIHDTDGRFVFANAATISLHGYESMAEFLQVNLHELDAPQSEALLAERFQRITEGGEARFEVVHYRKDGSTFPLEVLAKDIEWEGRPAVLSIATDITERKHMEEQLVQLQKMESVGRLAGGVAHDFNNMLGVILGHTEIALGELAADSPLRADLEEIQKAAERSANLTRQLLAFARKQTVAPKVLDLNETIASMLKMLQRLIGEDIDLLWRPGLRLARVLIDPGQVDQILANLAVNARDAVGHHHGRVTIETANGCLDKGYCANHADFVPGDYVMLAVSDNGCGMDEETRLHIFEPFFTTKAVGEGTGLGLATIYGIVKQNNGFINVYSEPGKGTTFRIYLPALKVEPGQGGEFKTAAAAPVGGHEVILVVEDEAALLNLAKTMLEHLGYTVLPAATPDDAIRIAHEHSGAIDLVITDVIMPRMNGRDLARNLQECFPGIRHLFMSGYTANVIAHQGVLDEGVNFIQKPFSLRDLAKKVREALKN